MCIDSCDPLKAQRFWQIQHYRQSGVPPFRGLAKLTRGKGGRSGSAHHRVREKGGGERLDSWLGHGGHPWGSLWDELTGCWVRSLLTDTHTHTHQHWLDLCCLLKIWQMNTFQMEENLQVLWIQRQTKNSDLCQIYACSTTTKSVMVNTFVNKLFKPFSIQFLCSPSSFVIYLKHQSHWKERRWASWLDLEREESKQRGDRQFKARLRVLHIISVCSEEQPSPWALWLKGLAPSFRRLGELLLVVILWRAKTTGFFYPHLLTVICTTMWHSCPALNIGRKSRSNTKVKLS